MEQYDRKGQETNKRWVISLVTNLGKWAQSRGEKAEVFTH